MEIQGIIINPKFEPFIQYMQEHNICTYKDLVNFRLEDKSRFRRALGESAYRTFLNRIRNTKEEDLQNNLYLLFRARTTDSQCSIKDIYNYVKDNNLLTYSHFKEEHFEYLGKTFSIRAPKRYIHYLNEQAVDKKQNIVTYLYYRTLHPHFWNYVNSAKNKINIKQETIDLIKKHPEMLYQHSARCQHLGYYWSNRVNKEFCAYLVTNLTLEELIRCISISTNIWNKFSPRDVVKHVKYIVKNNLDYLDTHVYLYSHVFSSPLRNKGNYLELLEAQIKAMDNTLNKLTDMLDNLIQKNNDNLSLLKVLEEED